MAHSSHWRGRQTEDNDVNEHALSGFSLTAQYVGHGRRSHHTDLEVLLGAEGGAAEVPRLQPQIGHQTIRARPLPRRMSESGGSGERTVQLSTLIRLLPRLLLTQSAPVHRIACPQQGVRLPTTSHDQRSGLPRLTRWPAISNGSKQPYGYNPAYSNIAYPADSHRLPVFPAADECLPVPFYAAGQAVGTI